MVLRVRQIGEQFFVPLSAQAVEALHLADGVEVEVRLVERPGSAAAHSVQSLSNDEAMEIYRSTEAQHRRAYEELAK